MLALVAAQLKYQIRSTTTNQKPIWVDIGGGTGWNIEAMAQYVDVPNHFEKVYLVDLSPSLLGVARERFDRLGWENVEIVCQDALEFCQQRAKQADLITLSYSLSMLPNFHGMIDSFASSLNAQGILAVVDFYVQSGIEIQGRKFLGGVLNRHVNWIGRTFWRAWFELDRISLEGARRVRLESFDGTNYTDFRVGLSRALLWHAQKFESKKSSTESSIANSDPVLHLHRPFIVGIHFG